MYEQVGIGEPLCERLAINHRDGDATGEFGRAAEVMEQELQRGAEYEFGSEGGASRPPAGGEKG